MLAIVEEANKPAALAENGAQKRRAGLPATGGVQVDGRGHCGCNRLTRMTMELDLDVLAQRQEVLVRAQD
jgi:hypothetical protein